MGIGERGEGMPEGKRNCGVEPTLPEQAEPLPGEESLGLIQPIVSLRLSKEKTFFGPGPALLLTLIARTGSVKEACRCMHISYTKAWTILNCAEDELGYQIVTRQHGGKAGGSCMVTPKGYQLLAKFRELEAEVRQITQEAYVRIFQES